MQHRFTVLLYQGVQLFLLSYAFEWFIVRGFLVNKFTGSCVPLHPAVVLRVVRLRPVRYLAVTMVVTFRRIRCHCCSPPFIYGLYGCEIETIFVTDQLFPLFKIILPAFFPMTNVNDILS
jgi:hypothetical protein